MTAQSIGDKALAVKWPAVPRVDYRLWKRVPEVCPEWMPIGSTPELTFLLEEWARDSGTELGLSAVNNGGESAKGLVVIAEAPSAD